MRRWRGGDEGREGEREELELGAEQGDGRKEGELTMEMRSYETQNPTRDPCINESSVSDVTPSFLSHRRVRGVVVGWRSEFGQEVSTSMVLRRTNHEEERRDEEFSKTCLSEEHEGEGCMDGELRRDRERERKRARRGGKVRRGRMASELTEEG